jgi:hypothetical protein
MDLEEEEEVKQHCFSARFDILRANCPHGISFSALEASKLLYQPQIIVMFVYFVMLFEYGFSHV